MSTTDTTRTAEILPAFIFRQADGDWAVLENNGFIEPEGTLAACIAHCEAYSLPYLIAEKPALREAAEHAGRVFTAWMADALQDHDGDDYNAASHMAEKMAAALA